MVWYMSVEEHLAAEASEVLVLVAPLYALLRE